ncbi:MAG: DNA-binding response regulator [Verrucomicrobiales bacterium]|nr:DNA-binding response regulator [Verrucomicrobiales bacterium]
MKSILVIEDEPHLRANLLTILQMENFNAFAAENGLRGVEMARQKKPDMILCDIMMPGLDGYSVLQELRSDDATVGIPFIFLTSKSDRTDLRTGMALGADDYLTKPFAVPELLSAIEARFLRLEQQRMQHKINFVSSEPLRKLGLTPREADVLFWLAQGKTNAEAGLILEMSVATVKKHVEHIFAKLGVENRSAAILRAIESLGE